METKTERREGYEYALENERERNEHIPSPDEIDATRAIHFAALLNRNASRSDEAERTRGEPQTHRKKTFAPESRHPNRCLQADSDGRQRFLAPFAPLQAPLCTGVRESKSLSF